MDKSLFSLSLVLHFSYILMLIFLYEGEFYLVSLFDMDMYHMIVEFHLISLFDMTIYHGV